MSELGRSYYQRHEINLGTATCTPPLYANAYKCTRQWSRLMDYGRNMQWLPRIPDENIQVCRRINKLSHTTFIWDNNEYTQWQSTHQRASWPWLHPLRQTSRQIQIQRQRRMVPQPHQRWPWLAMSYQYQVVQSTGDLQCMWNKQYYFHT